MKSELTANERLSTSQPKDIIPRESYPSNCKGAVIAGVNVAFFVALIAALRGGLS
jgi:hypothetical protein